MNHVDPETLAAWADGTLSSVEATAVESHLADCPQCRAVSAAFARTLEPAAASAPAVATSSARPAASASSFTKWALPIAATLVISAGLAWKLWPRAEQPQPVQRTASAPMTDHEPLAAATQPMAPTTAQPVAPAPPAREASNKSRAATTKSNAAPKDAKARDAIVALPAQPPPALIQPRPAAVASMPPPPPAAPPPPAQIPPTGVLVSQGVAGGQASANARASAASGVAVESATFSDRWRVIDFVSPPNPLFANAGGGAGRGGSARASVIARSNQVRWRASGPGTVERSLDGGVTWVPVAIDAAGVALTAGSAPSPDVCWLVGRAGVVLLSKDGGSFKPVVFPEGIDLVSVLATSELEATVVTADGRAFVTVDGGKTWRARF